MKTLPTTPIPEDLLTYVVHASINTATVSVLLLLIAYAFTWWLVGRDRMLVGLTRIGLVVLGMLAGVGGVTFAILKGWMEVRL